MSTQSSMFPICYDGWMCGACDGALDPDGLCASCAEEYGIFAEASYVDPYEVMDEMGGCDHVWVLWGGKYRCSRCGATQ